MEWLNEPASWQRNGDVLRVSVDPGTDFWRATGYGYVHDNGHVYGDRLPGDLDVSVRIRGAFASQYDQAGIMLRADEETWLKTGLEFFEGRPRLSTVLTAGWSSWMVADLPPGTDEVTLRVSRRGDAVEVRYTAGDGAAELAALVFLPPDREMLAGIMCAAPEGTGFSVAFNDLRVVGREWGGQEVADGAGWAGEAAWEDERAGGENRDAEPAWAGDRRGDRAAWVDEDREAQPAWAGDRRDDRADGRAGDGDRDAEPSWAGDRRGARADGRAVDMSGAEADDWAADRRSDSASSRAGDNPGARVPGWAVGKADDEDGRWAQDRPGEATGSWALGEVDDDAARWAPGQPGKPEPGRAEQKPAGKPAARKPTARKSTAGVPDGWDDELPGDESLDWAKPQASEPAADWDRLSLSLSTSSWNAFAAANPAEEQPGEPAREPPREPGQEQPGKPAASRAAGQDREDSAGEQPEPPAGEQPEPRAGEQPEPRAGEQPEPRAGGRAEPALTPADPAEAARPDETAREKNSRGKNKAKLPVPPALPPPADPADEWISLLTADSAEELSALGPAGELSGPAADEPGPE